MAIERSRRGRNSNGSLALRAPRQDLAIGFHLVGGLETPCCRQLKKDHKLTSKKGSQNSFLKMEVPFSPIHLERRRVG